MKHYVIGIDHGYGYVKTASSIMQSGVSRQVAKPYFQDDVLEYDGGIYIVGQDRAEHQTVKTSTNEYYLLTLAAMAKELALKSGGTEGIKASVTLGAGLPYAFMESQGKGFRDYLVKNQHVVYWFEGRKFDITIENVYLFPQGFAVIYNRIKADTSICAIDIGSRTVDLISFYRGRAKHETCATLDKLGTLDCIKNMRRALTEGCQITPPEELLQDFMQGDISPRLTKDQRTMLTGIIEQYIEDIFLQIETYGIDLQYDQCVICGGGALAAKNFGRRKNINVEYILDIHANAKGFEHLASTMENSAKR